MAQSNRVSCEVSACERSVYVLLVGAIFCSCSVNASFSELVGVRDGVDRACGKQDN